MKLGLSVPLPAVEAPAAPLGAALLEALAARHDVVAFVRGPEQVAPEIVLRRPVRPACDLPLHVADGTVDVPVHVLGDDDHHAHQVRWVVECPGVLVLLAPSLERLGRSLGEAPGLAERLRTASAAVIEAARDEDPSALAERIERAAADAPRKPPPPAVARDAAPKVEVVFVTYNSRKIVDEALRSALAQDHPNVVVTVVDNASADGTAEHVRATYPDVNLIASDENLGFAGGNNLAMLRSDAAYVALLNQDAVARRDWITEMLRPAEADPRVAVVGAKMLMRRCPTIFNSTGIAMNRTGFCFDRDIGERDLDPSPTPQEVLGVCGGAMLIRTSVVREIGGLEESFFMYFEDMDFAWRVWIAGWKIVYAPLSVVIHDWHGDLDDGHEADSEVENRAKTERRRVLCERNRLQCMLRNYELRTLLEVLPKAWRFDRQRLSWVKAAQARGENPEYFAMVGKAIRDAWMWNLKHLPEHLRNRRAIQRRRRVSDAELARLFGDWEGEPSFLGDLYAICDRHSAAGRPEVRMGKNDTRCLGAGWHGVEPLPDRDHGARWTKGTAWIYLRPEQDATELVVEGAAGPTDVTLRAAVGLAGGGERTVRRGERAVVRFPLERPAPAGLVQEIRLDANTFRPCDHGMGEDRRELGLRIESVRFEGAART